MDWEGSQASQLRVRRGCAILREIVLAGRVAGSLPCRGFVLHAESGCRLDAFVGGTLQAALAENSCGRVGGVCAVEVGSAASSYLVLLHRRRVTAAAARGDEAVGVCKDCHQAFSGKKPRLCKFSLANDLWLGRIDPLLWGANMTHEMCLAMARTVATKVVLRAGGAQAPAAGKQWDHVYQQTGYVGSSCFPQWRCQARSAVTSS